MNKIQVLILNSLHEVREASISALLNMDNIQLVGTTESSADLIKRLEEEAIDVLLIGAEVDGDGYKVSRAISRQNPQQAIIMLEESLDEGTLYKAVAAGAQDVVIYPFEASRLVEAVYHVDQLMKARAQQNTGEKQTRRRRAGTGQMMTVFSTKGGVGKTLIATNLAVALQQLTGQRVALLDLDLDFGNVTLNLNLLPKYTLLDVVDEIHNLDADLIESYMVKHDSGVMILPANSKPQLQEFVRADHVETILRILKESFDYIVVDMPPRFYAPVNPALAYADMVLMVTTPEISSIRNLKSALTVLQDFNFPVAKIRVLLNQSDLNRNINEKDVATTLGRDVFSSLRTDPKKVISALNEGRTLVNGEKRGLGGDFHHLAQKIANVEQPKKGLRKRFK